MRAKTKSPFYLLDPESCIIEELRTQEEKFKADFEALPEKLQLFIFRTIGQLPDDVNETVPHIEAILVMLDECCILNWSSAKIKHFMCMLFYPDKSY